MKILGLDPSLSSTGFGVVENVAGRVRLVSSGCIETKRGALSDRLRFIFEDLSRLLSVEAPEEVALEEGFYGKNVKVALSLGQARGVALLACTLAGVPVFEYSPREVKQAVVGRGAATKEQVNYMITALLKLKVSPQPLDVSDALAVAYCHSQRRGTHI